MDKASDLLSRTVAGGIWPDDKIMSAGDAILVSMSGIAVVFMALIFLSLAIVIVSKVIESTGIGKKEAKKTPEKSSAKMTLASKTAMPQASVEEDTQEYAAIIAAISEHTRTPIERLKIKSITKR